MKKRISDDDVRIGQRIKSARLARGISQSNLGEMLGVTFQQVQKYETGTNRVSGSRLIAIGSMLDVSVGSLLGEDAHNPVGDGVLTALATPGGHALATSFNQLPADRQRLLVQIAEAMVPL